MRAWISFCARYLVTAVVAGAAVWFFVPPLKRADIPSRIRKASQTAARDYHRAEDFRHGGYRTDDRQDAAPDGGAAPAPAPAAVQPPAATSPPLPEAAAEPTEAVEPAAAPTPPAPDPAVELEAANRAYEAYWRKVKILEEKRDAAQGAERIGYINELRGLQAEANQLAENLRHAQERYAQGNRRQTGTNEPPQPGDQAAEDAP